MAAAEHELNFELTNDTPYLALLVEIWCVCCEKFRENWLYYNDGMPLYLF